MFVIVKKVGGSLKYFVRRTTWSDKPMPSGIFINANEAFGNIDLLPDGDEIGCIVIPIILTLDLENPSSIARLNSDCVMNKGQADGFLKRPGTDERYERIDLDVTITTPRPKRKEATAAAELIRVVSRMTPEQFNELSSRKKWDLYSSVNGVWRCPECDSPLDSPERCSPFSGASRHCSDCETMLTRRTGGGQNDPFLFKLCNA